MHFSALIMIFACIKNTQLKDIVEAIKTRNLLPLIWSPWDDFLWFRGINIDRERKKEVTQE